MFDVGFIIHCFNFIPTRQRQRDPRLNEILFPFFDRRRVKQIIDTYELLDDYKAQGIMLFLCVRNSMQTPSMLGLLFLYSTTLTCRHFC